MYFPIAQILDFIEEHEPLPAAVVRSRRGANVLHQFIEPAAIVNRMINGDVGNTSRWHTGRDQAADDMVEQHRLPNPPRSHQQDRTLDVGAPNERKQQLQIRPRP